MTRFVVDTGAVLYLAGAEAEVGRSHELLAPTLLRSQTLSALHEAVHGGGVPADAGRERRSPPRLGRGAAGAGRTDADPAPRRRRAPAAGLGDRRPAGVGLDVSGRVPRPDAATGGGVGSPGPGRCHE